MNKTKIDINQIKITPGLTLFQCVKPSPDQLNLSEQFLKNSYKGNLSSFHPKRAMEIYLSQALIHKSINKKIPFESIKIESWQRIEGIKKYKFSLSHNPKQVSLLRYKTKKFLSCGLDEEVKTRKLKRSSSKLFINEKDNYDARLGLLSLWVIKEACFKAISPVEPKLKSLKQIEISRDHSFKFLNRAGTFKKLDLSKKFSTYIAMIEV